MLHISGGHGYPDGRVESSTESVSRESQGGLRGALLAPPVSSPQVAGQRRLLSTPGD